MLSNVNVTGVLELKLMVLLMVPICALSSFSGIKVLLH